MGQEDQARRLLKKHDSLLHKVTLTVSKDDGLDLSG
jgi:hypothetical protein